MAPGLNVNGSALAYGLRSRLPAHVAVTGGLAENPARLQETLVFLNSASEQNTVAVTTISERQN